LNAAWLFAQRCAIVLVLLIGARVARPVLVPLLLAAIACVMAGTPIARSPSRGEPPVLRAAAIALLPLALLASAALLLAKFAPQAIHQFDEARTALAAGVDKIGLHDDLGGAAAWLQSIDGESVRSFLRQQLVDASLVLAEAGVLSFFGLLSVRTVDRRLCRVLTASQCARLRSLAAELKRGLLGCLAVMMAVNAGLAVVLALSLALLGVPHAPAWAGVVFALLFVPYLGPLAAVGLLLVAGATRFGATPSMGGPALAFLCLHGIEANLISPWLTARRLQTSRVAVLIAVLAGTWAWGVIGGLLALPLLLGVRLTLARTAGSPVLHELLASEGAVDPGARSRRDDQAAQLAVEDLGPPDLDDPQSGSPPTCRIERVASIVDGAQPERRGNACRRAG